MTSDRARIRVVFATLALLASSLPVSAESECAPIQPGFFPSAIAIDGEVRTYHVSVGPDVNLVDQPPLILLFHGFGGSPRPLMANLDPSRSGLSTAILVGFEGEPRGYPGDDGQKVLRSGWQVKKGELRDRDLKLADGAIEKFKRTHCIDPENIYSVGFSNGGAFSQLLACERPGLLAGMALIGSSKAELGDCKEQVPVLLSHGKADRMVSLREAGKLFESWGKTNACKGSSSPPEQGCTKLAGCKEPVSMCVHDGGHTWPIEVTPQVVGFLAKETSTGLAAAKQKP